MREMSKKLNDLEISQSRSSLNSVANGSEASLASSTKSQSALDKKLSLHDQWLKDLDLRIQISDTATYDGILIWKISEYGRRYASIFTFLVYTNPCHSNIHP